MPRSTILICHWLPAGELDRWRHTFPDIDFRDGLTADAAKLAAIAYGLPPLERIGEMANLRWIQLASAGVPHALCDVAKARGIRVTNLAGLYGPTIAEHALAMLLTLSRNLHVAERNQAKKLWDRSVMNTMRDLSDKTLAVVGLGNIGCNIARLAKAFGMRVIGCKRTSKPCAYADQVFACNEVRAMFAQTDHVAIAAPLTRQTEGMIGLDELKALKPGAILINVSRGPIVQEDALVEALRSGAVATAGLDVFATEPLSGDHPFWTMPNVLVSPHYSGETVNTGRLPAERFVRSLRAFLAGETPEGLVDLDQGY